MKLNEVIDRYTSNKEEKEIKTKEYLKKLLNKDFEVILRVLDPRINHFSCYGQIDNEDIDRILKIYPEAKIEYLNEKIINNIYATGGHLGNVISFTIYNVNDENKTELIDKHNKQYKEEKERNRMNGIIY